MALAEPLFLGLPILEKPGHVDRAQRPCVRRGAHAAHHVLRDLAPDGRDPHDLVAPISRRTPWRRAWSRRRRSAVFGQVRCHVLAPHAPARAGALDLRYLQAVLLDELADTRA